VTSVTDELGAVVSGTEAATNSILAAAEEIDEITGTLSSRLSGEDAAMTQRISDRVITIFEACNFQDITGQRISKVVSSMKFIEERVTQMAHIWGGLESFNDVESFKVPEREGDEALLNGPALDGDPTRTSQDAIDALFG
jgi:chemotaxis protein CheZ